MRISLRHILLIIFLLAFASESKAQYWFKVGPQLPARGTSAFFFNAQEGVIGTGEYYPGSQLGALLLTFDGGNTWSRALLPNMNLRGQFTDIFFRTRMKGWATFKEANENGWSGIYHTIDGGKTWYLAAQALWPISVRETKRGVFFTDQLEGIKFSSDEGKTFKTIVQNRAVLGIDFLNDAIGYVSSYSLPQGHHLRSLDSGKTWTETPQEYEAWGVYADPLTKSFLYAGELDNSSPATSSAIEVSTNNGKDFTRTFLGSKLSLTGGIAGSSGCKSVIYAQRKQNGFLRSTDGGRTWIDVGGPSNAQDTRFAVTGHGAIVYAFDDKNNMWKTTSGGEGSISSSILPFVQLTILSPFVLSSRLCDSAYALVEVRLRGCDSAVVEHLTVVKDSLNGLEVLPSTLSGRSFSESKPDTIRILFRPQKTGSSTDSIKITFRQDDKQTIDTTIGLRVFGQEPPFPILISETTSQNTIDFGTVSICGGDSVREVTLTNVTCATLQIQNIQLSNNSYTLRSSFKPFTLSPGGSRTFLVRFKPSQLGISGGTLTVVTEQSTINVNLRGNGVQTSRGVKFSQSTFTSSICDSTIGTIAIQNTACSITQLRGITLDGKFKLGSIFLPIDIKSDSVLTVPIRFTPTVAGASTDNIVLHLRIDGLDFDTTVAITSTAINAGPILAVSDTIIQLGSVSSCSKLTKEIVIRNDGCQTLTINNVALGNSTQGFTITKNVNPSLQQGESDTVLVTFQNNQLGNYATDLQIATNGGSIAIPLSAQSINGQGVVLLDLSLPKETNVCQKNEWSIAITNSTCDPVTKQRIEILNDPAVEYGITTETLTVLASGESSTIYGSFAPKYSGERTAQLHIVLRQQNGTTIDTVINLTGIGLPSVPLHFGFTNSAIQAEAGQEVRIPLYLFDSTSITLTDVEFLIGGNTDLLTPVRFELDGTSLLNPTMISFNIVNRERLLMTVGLPSPAVPQKGLVGTLVYQSFITDTLSTTVTLESVQLNRRAGEQPCSMAEGSGEVAFGISPQCPDSTLSKFMAGRIEAVFIESITPVPTTGHIEVKAVIPVDLQQSTQVEILDALGAILYKEHLQRTASSKIQLHYDLQGGNGVRYLRFSNAKGTQTKRVLLSK